jgi:hypothetical protein
LIDSYCAFYGKGSITDYQKAQPVANQLFKYGEQVGGKDTMTYYPIALVYNTLHDDLEEAIVLKTMDPASRKSIRLRFLRLFIAVKKGGTSRLRL